MKLYLVLVACVGASAAAQPLLEGVPRVGGLSGGGPAETAVTGNCISLAERAAVAEHIAAYHAAHPEGAPGPYSGRTPAPSYEFYPIGGNWFADDFLNNFVDLNPGSGSILDWDCTNYTYDGHQGHDNSLRGWGEKRIGVPIFAALAGTVVDRRDGEPDENTTGPNVPANYVVLWHGGQLYTYYWHMKTGSVAVTTGHVVQPGQQLGLVASSGFSTGPHLHFETNIDGTTFEPFAGPCRAGLSGWASQQAIDRTFKVRDCGFTPTNLANITATDVIPRTGQLAFSERPHWFWIMANSMPANSTWRVRYFRPNGVQEFDSGVNSFGGNPYYPSSWWYWWYTIPNMGSIPGTWRLRLDINGTTAVEAPVEVRATRDPSFNRPPAALNGLSFDPPVPSPGHALFCRLSTSLTLDDPDYDIVRYTYVWTVNGTEVRRVTSAGHADAIAANLVTPGAVIRCTVMPSDGIANGPTSSRTGTAPVPCDPDYNQDGNADQDDIAYLVNVIAGGPNPTGIDPDFSRDGNVDQDDIAALINVIAGGGCP